VHETNEETNFNTKNLLGSQTMTISPAFLAVVSSDQFFEWIYQVLESATIDYLYS